MASTRNKNTKEDYLLEQNMNKGLIPVESLSPLWSASKIWNTSRYFKICSSENK